jgi:hypothetical protein
MATMIRVLERSTRPFCARAVPFTVAANAVKTSGP